jgi:hypothetical protein
MFINEAEVRKVLIAAILQATGLSDLKISPVWSDNLISKEWAMTSLEKELVSSHRVTGLQMC